MPGLPQATTNGSNTPASAAHSTGSTLRRRDAGGAAAWAESHGTLVVTACYGTVILVLGILAARVRRRGIIAPILDVFDQMYRPSAHEARFEILAEEERTAPNDTPDDEDAPIKVRRRA